VLQIKRLNFLAAATFGAVMVVIPLLPVGQLSAATRHLWATPQASAVVVSQTAVTTFGFTNSVPETPWWQRNATPLPMHTYVLSGDVLFDSGSVTLSPAAASQLQGVLTTALTNPTWTITVSGYTDNVPFPGVGNLALSIFRASTVGAWLEARGVAASRITVVGYGPADPVDDNSTAAGRALNRRVEIQLNSPTSP
jgi:outer membrane protein OmpA-like peptidoglycan-associated protein